MKYTHKILTFDVDSSGCIKDDTLKVMCFSGTEQEAIKTASKWKAYRDKQEPLGIDKDWGVLQYICHIWALDEFEDEIDYIEV